MPVVSNPIYNPTSAYQPVLYEVFYTSSPDIVKYCEFTVYVNGTAIATGRQTYYTTSAVFGSVEYYFKIDIQQYLQRYFASPGKYSMFGTLGAATQVDNTDAYGEVYVEFRYLILSDTTGKIYEAPSFDTSDVRIVDIATRQNGNDRSLTEFIWTPGVTPARFLTNAPLELDTCPTANAFVSFLSDWNWMRLQCYDSAGTQLSDGYAPTGGSSDIGHTTVGVGIPQLTAVTWFNAQNPVFTGAAFYVITFGAGFVASPTTVIFLGNSIQKAYRITDCCSKKLRLFWLNDLGGVDNYNFAYSELQEKTDSQVFEKPLQWPHLQYDFGKAVTNISASRSYLVRQQVTNAEGVWLRELLHSAEIYIQNPDLTNEYWRVYINPATFAIKVKRGFYELAFELVLSQDVVTHRV